MEMEEPRYYQILSGGSLGGEENLDEEIQREFAELVVLSRESAINVASDLSDDGIYPTFDAEDFGSKFLKQRRQELIVDPVRAEVAAIFGNGASSFEGDFWSETQRALMENPDDPDSVFLLAKKLLDQKSEDSLAAAKRLVFLPGDNKKPRLRWSNHEDLCVLAAYILRKESNFRAMIKVLIDPEGQPRFPENPDAKRLLVRALNENHRFEASVNIVQRSDREALYQNPVLMLNYVQALLKLNQDEEVHGLFSGVNPLFRAHAQISLVRPIFQLLHTARRYDLMLYMCCQVLSINPNAASNENFVDFASRSFNAAHEYAASVKLLAASESPIRGRFPRNAYCMKNLAYALIGLERRRDAEAIVDEAIRHGMRRSDFFHLHAKLRGGIKPKQPASARREREASGSAGAELNQ